MFNGSKDSNTYPLYLILSPKIIDMSFNFSEWCISCQEPIHITNDNDYVVPLYIDSNVVGDKGRVLVKAEREKVDKVYSVTPSVAQSKGVILLANKSSDSELITLKLENTSNGIPLLLVPNVRVKYNSDTKSVQVGAVQLYVKTKNSNGSTVYIEYQSEVTLLRGSVTKRATNVNATVVFVKISELQEDGTFLALSDDDKKQYLVDPTTTVTSGLVRLATNNGAINVKIDLTFG
ncbi:hypothetical protein YASMINEVIRUS_1143 [Yasminevirus sp. GU-2018]|uniref:Uncharacterized protein n=1 Tax=Yasminevirus sp. GU-2018 TaxID=2420051 RepID=A0A5K0UAL3_9VIRU|nr:hypothetical protein YASMINEVIRUS_1143 [Yasminevirus sp. GU-2018]